LTFGKLLKPTNITNKTFAAIAEFDALFIDESVTNNNADHWFQIDVMGVGEDRREEAPSDTELIEWICQSTHQDDRLSTLLATEPRLLPDGVSVSDGLVYKKGSIEVPHDDELRRAVLWSRHDSKIAGHPGRARTLTPVRQCFTWPSVTRFVHRYVNGCDLCQRVKPSSTQPLGAFEPLPIPAGPWTDISYDLITDLPESNGADSILTVINRLTKMAHFLPCRKTMMAEDLADLMLKQVWKLHGTPKTVVSDRGTIFVSQITKEIANRLGIKLHPSTV
jgi:hypothetical protein